MQLHQFRVDGNLDVTELRIDDAAAQKLAALQLVAHPEQSGVYRVQFVDEAHCRVAWDSYYATDPSIGTVMFKGRS